MASGSASGITIGEAFVRHLGLMGDLFSCDRAELLNLTGEVKVLRRGEDVFRLGDRPTKSAVVLEGVMQRYGEDEAGRRQIYSLYYATETPSLETLHMDVMDNSLGALSDCVVGLVEHKVLYDLMARCPGILHLIWRETLVQGAVTREWLMRNSIRAAPERMAHLFCETLFRAKAAGISHGNRCDLSVSQEDLGFALGLSSVHVNRTLMLLRQANLVQFDRKVLSIPDWNKMTEFSGFDPAYLHLKAKALVD